ncbi:MAG TPA: tetratricopeptide repeat protein [Calditrichia bacterium]|nr:tetratricopeptide repeat protein [Calditrichota bacterium]HQU71628.1 tetratricopeptide repeat protein [Calditrichia bacterium]HQV30581.1 tetratricopeptide repeat protein [Calditrichia bacterium]
MRFGIAILMVFALLYSCGKEEIRAKQDSEELDPTLVLENADAYFAEGDYENAFRGYGLIYYNHPTSREYIDGAIGLSRCYAELENYEKGFDVLYNLLRENLIPTRVPQIYNEIAGFYEKSAGISEQLTGEGSADYETAITYYKKSIDYPNSADVEAKGFAQYKIGALNERLERFQDALKAYETAINAYSESSWSSRAGEQISGMREKLQRRENYRLEGMLPDSVMTPQPPVTPVAIPDNNPAILAPPDTTAPDSTIEQ